VLIIYHAVLHMPNINWLWKHGSLRFSQIQTEYCKIQPDLHILVKHLQLLFIPVLSYFNLQVMIYSHFSFKKQEIILWRNVNFNPSKFCSYYTYNYIYLYIERESTEHVFWTVIVRCITRDSDNEERVFPYTALNRLNLLMGKKSVVWSW
jgi:hypothetical protein